MHWRLLLFSMLLLHSMWSFHCRHGSHLFVDVVQSSTIIEQLPLWVGSLKVNAGIMDRCILCVSTHLIFNCFLFLVPKKHLSRGNPYFSTKLFVFTIVPTNILRNICVKLSIWNYSFIFHSLKLNQWAVAIAYHGVVLSLRRYMRYVFGHPHMRWFHFLDLKNVNLNRRRVFFTLFRSLGICRSLVTWKT